MRIRVGALVLVAAARLSAQDFPPGGGPPANARASNRVADRGGVAELPLAERNYIMHYLPDDKTRDLFEASLAAHFPLYGRLTPSTEYALQSGKRSWATSLTFSMLLNLRMLTDTSAPVRHPSYMPRLRQVVVLTLPAEQPDSFHAARLFHQAILEFTLGHYSNGQDKCPFIGWTYAPPPLDRCLPPGGVPQPDNALVVDSIRGSFSGQYLELGLFWRRQRIGSTQFEDARVRSDGGWYVGLRARNYTALSAIMGGMDADMQRIYGTNRIRMLWGTWRDKDSRTSCLPGRWWLDAWAEYAVDASSRLGRVRGAFELGESFDALGGVGLFARYYNGHDDNNVSFFQHLSALQLGIAIGGERRLAIGDQGLAAGR